MTGAFSGYDDEVLSVKQVARELGGVHPQTVYARISDGSLRAVKRGNRFYIYRRWLREFLNDTEPASA